MTIFSTCGSLRKTIFVLIFLLGSMGVLSLLFWHSPAPEVINGHQTKVQREVSSNGILDIRFSKPIRKKSAEEHIGIRPSLKGSFVWKQNNWLQFIPQEPLPFDEEISITIPNRVTDIWGKHLQYEATLRYIVVSPPEISMISPIHPEVWKHFVQEKQTPLPSDTPLATPWKKGQPLTIMFNRPIRPLGINTDEGNIDPLDFLHFSPDIPGSVRWLGTNAFEFLPEEEHWKPAQEITITLQKGFPSLDGGSSSHGLTWNVTTDAPEIVSVSAGEKSLLSPENKNNTTRLFTAKDVLPDSRITITWSSPVELESFFQHLTITPQRKIKDDTIIQDPTDTTKVYLDFSPPLARDEEISITTLPEVLPLKGTRASEHMTKISFQTLKSPCFKIKNSTENTLSLDPGNRIHIDFCSLMQGEKDGKAVDMADQVQKQLVFTPPLPKESISVRCQEHDCFVSTTLTPGQKTSLSLNEGLTDMYGQNIPSTSTPIAITIRDFPAYLSPLNRGTSQSLFDMNEKKHLFFQARNISSVEISTCIIPKKTVLTTEAQGSWHWRSITCASHGKEIRTIRQEIPEDKNILQIHSVLLDEERNSKDTLFWEISSPEYKNSWDQSLRRYSGVALAANASLLAKSSDEEVFVWATDFDTGEPIPEMTVALYGEGGEVIDEQTTDASGITLLKKPPNMQQFFITGTTEKYQAFVGEGWDSGLNPWDFDLEASWDTTPQVTGVIYTDRPLYTPSDSVFFKGILRTDDDATLSLPTEEQVRATIHNSRGEKVYDKTLPLSSTGTFSDSFSITESASTGRYFLRAKSTKTEHSETFASTVFWTEEYKKPVFAINFDFEKDDYISGDTLIGNIQTKYFFGAPLPNANISWHIVETPFFFDRWSGEGWYNFGTENTRCWWCAHQETEEIHHTGEAVSDAQGNTPLSLPLATQKHSLFTLRATATDSAGQTTSASHTFPVFAGEFVLGVRPQESWLNAKNTHITADVIATDILGNPITSKKFIATLQQVIWNSVQKKDIDGEYYWESNKEIRDLHRKTDITNIGGRSTLSFELKDAEEYFGQLQIKVESLDTRGNTIAATTSDFWRSSQEYTPSWRRKNNDRITLHLSQFDTEAGETITILPESPFEQTVSALITAERNTVLFSEVRDFFPGEPITLLVTKEMVPNAFLSVTLSKGKGLLAKVHTYIRQYHEESKAYEKIKEELKKLEKKRGTILEKLLQAEGGLIPILEKGLHIIEKDIHEHEEQNTMLEEKITTLKDAISSEVDITDDIPEIGNEVPRPEMKIGFAPLRVSAQQKKLHIKIHTKKEVYLPGENVETELFVTDFQGNPVVNADLSLAVVDTSLLALKSRPLENIFDTFYAFRGLGVRTAHSLTTFVAEKNVQSAKGKKGGGGGRDLDLLKKRRGIFKDTAFWKANITTNQAGYASASFDLPDNTTAWQIWTEANTADSRFGTAKQNFVSKKPLMLQAILPRFLHEGDTATIGVSVLNQYEEELIVQPKFTVQNAEIIAHDNTPFRLQKDGRKDVFYTIQAQNNTHKTHTPPPLLLTFQVLTEREEIQDTLDIEVPVLPLALGETVSTNGFLQKGEESVQQDIFLPSSAIPTLGNLLVSFSAAGMGDISSGLQKLMKYPYGCAEQIISAHLPNVFIPQIEEQYNASFLRIFAEEREKFVNAGLQKIYELQKNDGGFGFWKDSKKSSPYLTAYVLFGLEQTRRAGHSVDTESIHRATMYIRQRLSDEYQEGDDESHSDFMNADARSFGVYVLSLGEERFDESLFSRVLENRFSLSAEGKAFALLTAHNLGKQDIVDTMVTSLEASLQQEDRIAFFVAGKNQWNFSSNIRATAIGLLGLLTANPDHPAIPKILAFLRETKDGSERYLGGQWQTTQNTSWVLLALSQYLARIPSEQATAQVTLNSEEVATSEIPKIGTQETIDILMTTLQSRKMNTLSIAKEGGAVNYDIVMNTYVPADTLSEKNNGYGVIREYTPFPEKENHTPVSSVKKGETLKGKVSILIDTPRYYTGVKIPLPAGLEAINFTFENQDTSLQNAINTCKIRWCPENNIWRFYHREFRDDHIFLFAEYLPAGRYDFEYLVRATTTGAFSHLPVVAEDIYHPEIFGRTGGETFEVR